jgi:N-acetylglucosaminyldiphosphoundecaprenol N-acetyl-beta-D-mannosaminyltransferase
MNEALPTSPVLGVPLAATDYEGAVGCVKDWAAAGDRAYTVAATATHPITTARRDPQFRKTLASLDLILPDGMPLIWVMNRRVSPPLRDRVYGPTFMLKCLEATAGAPWSHVFVGATDDLLAELRARLQERFPGLRIAGMYSPPFGDWGEEIDREIVEMVRSSGAQFVWVALGSPKQEGWLARMKPQLPPAVYLAVGAAFAFHAGRLRQAPAWMQRHGLEWLFRLVSEPKRLWKRYLVCNTLFIWYTLWDWLMGRAADGKGRSTSGQG